MFRRRPPRRRPARRRPLNRPGQAALQMLRRANRLMKQFAKAGMTEGRFRIEWISAAEGDAYARVINEMQELLDSIPKEELLEEIERLRPEMEKRARRMSEAPQVEEALAFADRLTAAMLESEVEAAE